MFEAAEEGYAGGTGPLSLGLTNPNRVSPVGLANLPQAGRSLYLA